MAKDENINIPAGTHLSEGAGGSNWYTEDDTRGTVLYKRTLPSGNKQINVELEVLDESGEPLRGWVTQTETGLKKYPYFLTPGADNDKHS